MSRLRTYRRNIFASAEVAWNLLLALVILFAAYRIPHDILLKPETTSLMWFLNAILLVSFLLDPFVSYFFATTRGPDASRGYTTFLLPIDIICALPFVILQRGDWLELVVLLKVVHVAVFVNQWRHQLLRIANVVRFTLFLYLLAIVIHLTACGWIYIRDLPTGVDPKAAYLKAVYWAVTTLTTVGYGDITPTTHSEMLYAIVVMLLGFGMFGYLIGNIASMLNASDPLRAQQTRILEEVSAFVRENEVSADLKHRILDYFMYMFQKRVVFDESRLLNMLPYGLRSEVSLYLKRDVIQRVPFFKTASDQFIREISNAMRPLVVTPDEDVFHIGDRARHMYFIVKGQLDVTDENNVVVGTLTDGDFFGEMALLEKRRRMANVRAVDYCELYVLDHTVFEQLVHAHPDFRLYLQHVADQRTSSEGEFTGDPT